MSDFMTPGDHFEVLAATLDSDERAVYDTLKHVRIEPCFRNRSFIVYRMEARAPRILDRITILDFDCNDDAGASCEVRSAAGGSTLVVGYTPIQLFSHPVFVHLPLHGKLRWSTTPDKPLKGSLAFDLVIRTQSRPHLRERGVVYCETGVNFGREFGNIDA